MRNDKYYLLTVGTDSVLLETLRAAHAATWPQNQLGVSSSLDGSKLIVKVDWGEATPNAGIGQEVSLKEVFRLLDSPEWGAA